MSDQNKPNTINGGGGDIISTLRLNLDIEAATIENVVAHRGVLIRFFDVYCTEWIETNDVVLSGMYYKNMLAVETAIQQCDLRITRLIEIQGSYRQQRIDDENLPF